MCMVSPKLVTHHSWSFFKGEHPCGGHVDVQDLLELKQTRVSVYPEFQRFCHYWMEEGLSYSKQVKRQQKFASLWQFQHSLEVNSHSFFFVTRQCFLSNVVETGMMFDAETLMWIHQHFYWWRLGNTGQMWANQTAVRSHYRHFVGLCSICWHIISGGRPVHCCAN